MKDGDLRNKNNHSRQRADSVCSINKTQTANGAINVDNFRVQDTPNNPNLVSPLHKNNLIGLAAMTPMEMDQRN